MSETSVRNDVSSESLCTVIENCTDNNNLLPLLKQHHTYNEDDIYRNTKDSYSDDDDSKDTESGICDEESIRIIESHEDLRKLESPESIPSSNGDLLNNSLESNCDSGGQSGQDQVDDAAATPEPIAKPLTKLKKSVSFDPNDEKIRKFISGEPIVDQRNPFKGLNSTTNGSLVNGKAVKKKTPPPVPARRSTLSVRKTVTQQLREREREKEKERVRNDANQRKSSGVVSSPDEFVTTEEVLKQSKYVKTYIKNPDPVFVYDPTVLARLKFEELREIADKKPPKKLKLSTQTRERLREVKHVPVKPKEPLAFKKCSKPNYPELADIKVRVGPESPDGNYFNPAEVTKNAKKFDERVKKLHIGCEDDLDEIEEPLTKSESSDEVTLQTQQTNTVGDIESPTDIKNLTDLEEDSDMNEKKGKSAQMEQGTQPVGTFTNTIKSREFQEYLDKKGLSLIPKKIPSGAHAMYTVNGGPKIPRTTNHISFAPSPERVQLSINRSLSEESDGEGGKKKPSVFQRLLAHSIFASRRKTTPKEAVPMPRRVGYSSSATGTKENNIVKTPSPIRRVVLERQSFHGRPRASNLLSAAELKDLKNQTERTRKSFASGDDLSVSISSALTNAEDEDFGDADDDDLENKKPLPVTQPRRSTVVEHLGHIKPIVKPPRRTVSKDRLTNGQHLDSLGRSKVPLPGAKAMPLSLPRERNESLEMAVAGETIPLRRSTLERQSLIPRRTMTPNSAAERRQVFGRTASMDRNEILKRNTTRGPPRSKSAMGGNVNKMAANISISMESRENLEDSQFSVMNGPQLTSTPIRDSKNNNAERKAFTSIPSANVRKPPPGVVYVDPNEWERLRAIKERTDKELYYKMMQHQQNQLQHQQNQLQQQQKQQQQQQQQRAEMDRIYERLPQPTQTQVVVEQHQPPQMMNGGFVRGSPQRNTFSGVIPNRQAKIIDGRPVMTAVAADPNGRSQSVLDGMTMAGGRANFRRGYESENETPVIMRRQKSNETTAENNQNPEPRRIGGLLTREEILQKVKEFCRKSLNKTPVNQTPHMQAIYEKDTGSTDLSPVSYASVQTQQRPGSRLYAAPQVPQRMQSLPQQFIPIQSTHEVITQRPMAVGAPQHLVGDSNTTIAQLHTNPSPIYAHVIKRSSLQSNQSADLYDTPQPPRQYIVRRDSDTLQPVYISRPNGGVATLQRPESAMAHQQPTQYVIVDSEKLSPAQVYNYYQADIYAQPQYIRPHHVLQPIASTPYGYISVREPHATLATVTPQQLQQQQQLRTRLLDGRSTPLILDRSSQQASQIYWTPQHQRLQQHTGLVPVQISPRYTSKQSTSYPGGGVGQPMAAPHHFNQQQVYAINNIPQQQQMVGRTETPTKQPLQRGGGGGGNTRKPGGDSSAYDWESGSEAGEVQRIMEQQSKKGEFNSMFKNLRIRVARIIGGSRKF